MDPSGLMTLHDRFSSHAAAHPDHTALVARDVAVSYRELDARSGVWASALAARGIGTGDVVPIDLPRSVDMVTAILAVLKTGAAYTLVDPGWPAERVRLACTAVGARLVVDRSVARQLDVPDELAPPQPRVGPTDAACVFFTSGTTGTPKAVLTPHAAVLRLFAPGASVPTGADLVISLAAALPWDAFALELWSALATGGAAVLIRDQFLTSSELRDVVARAGVNTAWLTSSLFNLIVDEDPDAFSGLATLLIGGERLSVDHVRRFMTRHPRVRLVNGYGPVETTVFATTHDIVWSDTERVDGIPLGRPVPRTDVRVLVGDRAARAHEHGEIVIGGDGLAIGYLNDPHATAEKFVELSDNGAPSRFYRSGDLGFVDDSGVLHYVGRVDRQLKIRGVRVEPARIERVVLATVPVVSCHVVGVRDDASGTVHLTAFCVRGPDTARDDDVAGALRAALLPQEVPTVVWIDQLPLTGNGKVDEAELLATLDRTPTSSPSVGVSLSLGDEVLTAFKSVLARSVSHDTSFFAAGGTSLGAGRVCARLSRVLARPVSVSQLFEEPTAAGLTRLLEDAGEGGEPSADLSSMQRIFLLKTLLDPGDLTNHCLMVWHVHGPLDRVRLGQALASLHRRQPMLHARFGIDAGIHVDPSLPPPSLREIACVDETHARTTLQGALSSPLDPARGHVWQSIVASWGVEDALLGLAFHHVAFDGASEAVVARNLSEALGIAGAATDVVPVRSRWSTRSESTHGTIEALVGVPSVTWPADDTDVLATVGQVEGVLAEPLVRAAGSRAARAASTLLPVLLYAWAQALAEVCGSDDLAIGVPVSLRDGELGDDVGCHMTTVAIRLRGETLVDTGANLEEVARSWGRAVAQREVPLTDVLRTGSHGPRPPVFQTMLALQGHLPPELDVEGTSARFVRLPYLDLPLEMHLELWPQESGDLAAVVSYRSDAVGRVTAQRCLTTFLRRLVVVVDQGATSDG